MSNVKRKGVSRFGPDESVCRKHEFGNWQVTIKRQLFKTPREMNQISLAKRFSDLNCL